jgi:hypothetical protein
MRARYCSDGGFRNRLQDELSKAERKQMNLALGFIFVALGAFVIALVGKRNPLVARPLYAGFAARTALAVTDIYFFPIPGLSDGLGWHTAAIWRAKAGLATAVSMIDTGHMLYKWFMGVMYCLLGPSRLMIQEINVIFGVLIVFNVWQIARLVWRDERTAVRAAWVTALFPSMIMYSAALLREVAVVYPLSLGVIFIVRWIQDRKAVNMVKAAAALLVSMAFHSGTVGILFAAGVWVIGSWLRAVLTGRYASFGRKTVALAVAIGVLAVVMSTGFGMDKFRNIDVSDTGTLRQTQDYYSYGRTAYLPNLRADDNADLALQSPIRMAYFLFAPFPWMVSTLSDVFGLVDSLLFFWLVYRLWRARRSIAANPSALVVVAVFVSMAFVFAIGVQNYGTAMRHRDKILPILIAVGAAAPAVARAARSATGRLAPTPGRPRQLPQMSQGRPVS